MLRSFDYAVHVALNAVRAQHPGEATEFNAGCRRASSRHVWIYAAFLQGLSANRRRSGLHAARHARGILAAAGYVS